MRSLSRTLLLLSALLLVPILPFLLLGASFEQRIEGWLKTDLSDSARFGLIVAALSTDVLLPIPSSMVSTYGGGILGTWPAAAASWLGMTLGAVFGFWLARLFGRPFASRLSGSRDLDQMMLLARRFGPMVLVLTRALPILAEACVLLMGTAHLSWRRFLVPVLVSNFVISLTYSACGEYFEGQDAFVPAVILSGTVPLSMALIVRRWLPLLNADSSVQVD